MSVIEKSSATGLPSPPASPARAVAASAALITAVAAAVASLIALAVDATIPFSVAKPVPAVALAVWTALKGQSRAARWVVCGLLASAVGDALLEVEGAFIGGMAAFALGHIAYLVALVLDHRRLQPILAIPFGIWGVGLFLFVRAGLGPLAVPVAVYSAILCAMMWRAAARFSMDRTRSALIGLIGAVLFGLSDSLIAVRLGGTTFPGMSFVVLITYWIGQAGIAASFAAPRLILRGPR